MSHDDHQDGTSSFALRLTDLHCALLAGEDAAVADVFASPGTLDSRWTRAAACVRAMEVLRVEQVARGDGEIGANSPPTTFPLRFGRFEVLAELGRGGHGIVYLAFDPELRRRIALKVPRPEFLGDDWRRERFLDEARVAASLNHPNLVAVYEVGSVGPAWFIATQYCRGPSLSNWLRAQAELPDPRAAAELVATIADATNWVHNRGIIHRDIKPGNILLDPIEEAPLSAPAGIPGYTPRLADFGLAQLCEGDSAGSETGVPVGTLAYMAPEQAAGQRREIGPAGDIYALGVVLYELLTGTTPFQGIDDLDTLRRIDEGRFEPAAQRRCIPHDLDAISRKCLEYEPGRRYRSAGDLSDDLRRFLRGEPVRARQPGSLARLVMWSRRQPMTAGLVSTLVVGALTAFMLVLGQWRAALTSGQRAARNFSQAHRALHEIHDVLFDGTRDRSSEFQPLRREVLRATLKYLDELLSQDANQPELIADVAEAHYHAGFLSETSGDMAVAERSYERAMRLWKQIERPRDGDARTLGYLLKTHHHLAAMRHFRGDFVGARDEFQQALRFAVQWVDVVPAAAGSQELADVYRGFAAVCKSLGDRQASLSHLQSEREIRRQRADLDSPDSATCAKLAVCEFRIANVLQALEQHEESAAAQRRGRIVLAGLARPEELSMEAAYEVAQLLHVAATFDFRAGRSREFIDSEERALSLFGRLVLEESWSTRGLGGKAYSHLALARHHDKRGDAASAEAHYEEACRSFETITQRHPDVTRYAVDLVTARCNFAKFHTRHGRLAEARADLEQAISANESITAQSAGTSACAHRLARVRGRLAKALGSAGMLVELDALNGRSRLSNDAANQ